MRRFLALFLLTLAAPLSAVEKAPKASPTPAPGGSRLDAAQLTALKARAIGPAAMGGRS
jgi:hypothetical protein